ncbi:hypothetical protein MKW92_002099 [Papaver armeniacum]|nr:hypothetical protein MKW92_002099 [Papaver armeniacum]
MGLRAEPKSQVRQHWHHVYMNDSYHGLISEANLTQKRDYSSIVALLRFSLISILRTFSLRDGTSRVMYGCWSSEDRCGITSYMSCLGWPQSSSLKRKIVGCRSRKCSGNALLLTKDLLMHMPFGCYLNSSYLPMVKFH